MREKENIYTRVLGFCFHTLLNIAFVLMLLEGYSYSYSFSYRLFGDIPAEVLSTKTMSVAIDGGDSAKEVAEMLKLKGIISDPYVFLARTYIGKYSNRIQTGTYTLGPGMSPDQICKIICGQQSEETKP